ncbi:AAA-ATPase At3g50940-like [Pyrus communis]|uniref:AAA-ATPase At3g50940-like n=1 Tax=Pyrus communis TaxID=23211 RepID=UPI0035C0FFD4
MPETKALLPAIATLAASAMLVQSIANDFISDKLWNYFYSGLHNISRRFSSQLTIVIDEFQGLFPNEIFEAAHAYLGAIVTPSVRRIKASKDAKEKKLAVSVDRGEELADVYENVQIKWKLIYVQVKSPFARHRGDLNASLRQEARFYELTFHKKHKEKVLNSYLPYILERSKEIKREHKAVKFHTVEQRRWFPDAVKLDHPMTFKLLAMDTELKKAVLDDLNNFINGKEFYRRVGKTWKRGYLLYGPPGTGKSSRIAAMANHLNYDIYELDLTNVNSNSDLSKLLFSMPNQSIIVFEDVDCTIKLKNGEPRDESWRNNNKTQVTLSGLLNFLDGFPSCCGEERIIIFTTNHKDRLDPALLRPGRMDMHIHMSYCTTSAFKQLAFNYHGLCHHNLFTQIEGLIWEVEVTPAEVAGQLMKSKNAHIALQCLFDFLLEKKIQHKGEEES